MRRWLRDTAAIAAKDLRSELRTKEALNASLSFSVVILLLFSFAFDPGSEQIQEFAGGLLWLVFAFAGALILNRSFARELPNDCLDALVASPVSSSALFLGKALANWVLLVAVEIVSLAVFLVFYNVTWRAHPASLLAVLGLGSWGMAVIGTMFSALTVNLRLRELMLPMLVYPVMIPALMASIQLTSGVLSGQALVGDILVWLRLLAAFDAIFTALSLVLAEAVLVN